MAEIDQAKLVRLVKSGKSQSECAAEFGITPGQLGMPKFGQALVSAGKLKKAPATTASFKALRKEGIRWEYISAMTGASVAKIKDAVGESPRVSGNGSGRKTAAAGRKTGVKTVASGSKKSAAGRKTKTAPARSRTRAARAARSGNPS